MKRAHFVGIAGVGMSATALLLRESGWQITGSDEGSYPPVSDYLARAGITVRTPYAAKNIPKTVDLIIIGKSAKLTNENPEVRAAHERSVPIKNFAEVLGEILQNREPIVIAGSYGKSTAAALMSWILIHAGKDSGYMVGAIAHDLKRTSQLGTHRLFVIEGDEYPSGHDDPRAKFLHYHAHDLLLTSAAHDHVNIFPTHADYLAPFRELITSLPKHSLLVACADDAHVLKLCAGSGRPYVTYGLTEKADWSVRDITYHEKGSSFILTHGGDTVHIETSLLGAHNVQNIVGVAALLIEKGLTTADQIAAAVKKFQGVVRRLDLKTHHSPIPVFEGFGSSYEKARTAIDAIRLHFSKRRLIIFFEPHTFSWRNRAMLHWYDSVFSGVDHVCVYPPPLSGATTHAQLTHDDIITRIALSGVPVTALYSAADAFPILETLQKNDVVLLLTSGHMGGLVQDIPAWLDAHYTTVTSS
ncbi:hypothetical protein HY413_02265 [Candidatus Kaiserbacteria bacterium]|nr:hypothetical protein [Candidatus Kaiserbacteria bacterium]